ncbi:hypothetical protein Tco_0899227 [Tanacetum coccineum]
MEDDKETTELKQLMKIIPDEEEVAIDAIPLAVKSPSIVGWKIYKEGRKSYYQIMRADGKSQMYMFLSQILKSFDREDLETLYKLLKAKFESTSWEDLDCVMEEYSFKGRIVGIKSLLDAVWITFADVFVNTAQLDLVLLVQNCSPEVDAASENMLEVTTASEYQINVAKVSLHHQLLSQYNTRLNPATENSLAVPEQTTVETVMNMTPENRAHFELKKEAIHLILTGIGDEIYLTVDAYPYYQSSKSYKSYAPTSKASLPTRSHATTRYKGKEIAKPITPPSESASEEDSDPEQAYRDKDM